MNTTQSALITNMPVTLELKGIRSYLFQVLFISIAVLLPAASHLAGAPVKYLLPMHWAVILAGLVYGWRGGAISGLLAPLVSFMITSMPPAPVLPAITAELIAYGFIAGLLREKLRVNPFMAVFAALVIGRILFMVFTIASGTAGSSAIAISLLPGIAAAAAQIVILPFVARWWVKKESGV